MKITFMTPPYDMLTEGKGSKVKIKYGNLPPLGILYIIGELRRHNHECELIDLSTFPMSNGEILDKVQSFGPDLIGVSTMTPSFPHASRLVRFLKKELKLPVIIGGVHCTSFKENVLKELPEVDVVCIGEGETTMVEIIQAYEGNMAWKDIKGICFKGDTG